MRILCLTQWFEPEPIFKGLAFARELARAGHSVEVITGFPNYPGGRLYPGYRIRPMTRQFVDGVHVTRVALYPSHDRSGLRRALNYASFAATSSLYGILGARRADVAYVYHPPLTVGMSAVLIGLARRIPFVYDVQDLWPDTLAATGMVGNAAVLGAVGGICGEVYRRAAHIVTQSHGFRERLIARGVPASKIDVIYNWCDEGAIASHGAGYLDGIGLAGKFKVVFAGTMGRAQAIPAVLGAAELLLKRRPEIHFVFVGGGTDVAALHASAKERNLSNVTFLAAMPMAEIGKVLHSADVLLVHLRNDPLFEITIPSKTQAYLSVGKPILMAVRGDARRLVEEAGAGVPASSEDPVSIADAVVSLADLGPARLREMGERGARFYRERLSLRSGAEKFLALFERVARKR